MANQAVLQCEVSVSHCVPLRIPLCPMLGHILRMCSLSYSNKRIYIYIYKYSGTLLGAVISGAFMQIILSKIVMKILKFT